MLRNIDVRLIAFLILLAGQVTGEIAFSGLATNIDGSVLYFSSPLRLKDSAQPPWPKIFSWNSREGVRLHEQRDARMILTGSFPGSYEPYRLVWPRLSDDGSTFAFTGMRDCNWGNPCVTSFERYQSTIRAPGRPDVYLEGTAMLSPNGRYALLATSRAFAQENMTNPPLRWIDLQTGEVVPLTGSPLARRHTIANDGTIVRYTPGRMKELWRPGYVHPLPYADDLLLINATASLLIGVSYTGLTSFTGLTSYEIGTGKQTTLFQAQHPTTTVDISGDGSIVAFTQAGCLHTVRSDGSGLKQYPALPHIVDLAVSGDGTVLFAVTDVSSILRVHLATGAMTEIVAPTRFAVFGYNEGVRGEVAPGALLQLTSVRAENFPDVKPEFGQFRGNAWPVLNWDRSTLTLQVPWEMPVDTSASFLELALPSDSPTPFQPAFISSAPLRVRPEALWWLTYPRGALSLLEFSLVAAHSDFSGIVTAERPARAGEVIHAYGTGFGPVTATPRTGEPASAHPLSVLTNNLQCELEMYQSDPFRQELAPIQVLFAGLAPGMIGVYQIDLLLPDRLTFSQGFVRCRAGFSITGARLPLAVGNR